MKKDLEPLFTPWQIGKVTIKNRIVLTSMGGTNLLGWMERNHFDEVGAQFLQRVAEHEVGLVLPGCQAVHNPMFGQWLYKNKKMYRDLAQWLTGFHKTGAKLFVQLTAGFGRSFTITPMMETLYTNPILRFLSKPVMNLDQITASASEAPNRWSDKVPSRAMRVDEIARMVEAFGKTARLLQEAGVDGVEVHAVHEGYLLDQFTLPYVNHRTDAYGGNPENRYRFAVEIVQAIKRACGPDFPVSLRYSVVSKTKGFRQGALPGETYEEVGRDLSESRWAARYLQEAGYDMLNCDNGTYDAWYWAHPPIYMPENCNLPEVREIKKAVDIPVVVAGRMDPLMGAQEVAKGTIDAVGFARSFLADQEWVSKLREDRAEEIRPCILCHNACFNMSKWAGVANQQELQDALHLARCAVNAETMQWDQHYIQKTTQPKTVHIIGGGIAGMEAARVLKLRGHEPIVYEKSDQLGGVVIPGGAESYKKPMRDLLDWYRREMDRLAIQVHLRTEIQPDHDFAGDPVLIATGGAPLRLSKIPGFDRMIEATDFLLHPVPGQKVAIIGGSLTGCEIAYELALQGRAPFLIEMKEDLIATPGVCLANSSYLREWFALHQVPVFLRSTLVSVEDQAVRYQDENGQIHERPCDLVISAVGYRPAPLDLQAAPGEGGRRTGARSAIYQIGDCAAIGNIKTAVWQAYETAMKI